MHPVLHDNLRDHEAKAEATVDGNCTRGKTFELILSAMRLYRNFAVLVASGRIEFPQQCAQAVVSTAAADLHEIYPEFYRHRNENCSVLNLDEALDTIEDFGEELLCLHEGDACLKQYEHEEEDEPEETGFVGSDGDQEPEDSGCERSSDVQAVEDQLNASYQDRHGWEPSRARQDYHALYAKFLCGAPMTEHEQSAYNELHQQVVEEQAARVAAERAIQTRRERLIEAEAASNRTPTGRLCEASGEQVAGAIIEQAEDRALNHATLHEANDIIAGWLFNSGQLEILAKLARRLSLGSPRIRAAIHNAGGIVDVLYTDATDRFDLALKNGMTLAVLP